MSAVNATARITTGTIGGALGATAAGGATATAGAVHSTYAGLKECLELPRTERIAPREDLTEKYGEKKAKKSLELYEKNEWLGDLIKALAGVELRLVEEDGRVIQYATDTRRLAPPDEHASNLDKMIYGARKFARSGIGKTVLFGLGGAALAAFLVSPAGWPFVGALAAKLGLTGIAGGAAAGVGIRAAWNVGKRAALWTVASVCMAVAGGIGGAVIGSRLVPALKPRMLKRIDQLPQEVQQMLREAGALAIQGKPGEIKKIDDLAPRPRRTIRANNRKLTAKGWDGTYGILRKHTMREIRESLPLTRIGQLPKSVQGLLKEGKAWAFSPDEIQHLPAPVREVISLNERELRNPDYDKFSFYHRSVERALREAMGMPHPGE